MLIKTLKLTNYRGFGDLTLHLSPGLNLLIGTNGAGKTTLLDAVNLIQAMYFNEDKVLGIKGYFDFDDIRINENGQRKDYCMIEADIKTPDKGLINAWRNANVKVGTKKKLSSTSKGTQLIASYGSNLLDHIKSHPEGNDTVVPLLVYYSSQRLHRSGSKSANQTYDKSLGRLNGYLLCLDEKSIYPILIDWLGEKVTNRATRQIKTGESQDVVLDNIESALAMLFSDVTGIDGSLKIWYEKIGNEYKTYLQVGKSQGIPIDRYSDGWKNLIFLVMDMVWRASQLNPSLNFEQLKAQTHGIVLIDEIDLHIHVKWQMKLTGFLQKLFPNVQFVVTTHSPSVISGFKPRKSTGNSDGSTPRFIDTLLMIERSTVKDLSDIGNRSVISVLEDVLGATNQNPNFQSSVRRLKQVLNDANLDNSEKVNLSKDLLKEIEQLSSAYDPEYVKLHLEVQLLELT